VAARLLILLTFALTAGYPSVITDTVGWTTRDRQFPGPALRYIYYDTLRGLHITYKDGYGAIRYSFKPRGENWCFRQPVLLNPYPRNLGSLDINITNGRPLISADRLEQGRRVVSCFSDSNAGAGRFYETEIATDARFSLVAAARFGYPKFAAIRNDSLYYLSPWSFRNLGPIGPFPRHNIAASKISSRLGFVWAEHTSRKLFFRETPDNGGTWYPVHSLSDSVPGPLNRSLFAGSLVYDSIQPHLVCDLYDGTDRGKVQLWHYCPYQRPAWSLICEYRFPDTARLGLHTLALDRPAIGIDRRRINSDLNRLYVVWEQFNPDNIDPVTGIARTDIWGCASFDNGRTWTLPVRLTQPDETSKRFPSLAEVVDDTLHILCFADRQAGSWELGEGNATRNAVIHLRVPAEIFTSQPVENHSITALRIPTILNARTVNLLPADFHLYDRTGRKVPARNLHLLPAGVYFMQIPAPSGQIVQPLVKPE